METDTHICPSLLRETGGESGYSPKALKLLFDGENISCELPYKHFDDNVALISSITIANAYLFQESRLSIL